MKNRSLVRKRLKQQFVLVYKPLFIEHEKLLLCHHEHWQHRQKHRTEPAKKIIKLARENIGYSAKTSDCDLFCTLMWLYKTMMQNGTSIVITDNKIYDNEPTAKTYQ
jgi:hypothetical protein